MQSFQEMYIKDVQEYAKYAHQHLAQGGMVYSENGIDSLDSKEQRTKKFSDYGLHDKFDLVSLEHGKRFCPNMFCGNKHEAVFIKKSGDQGKSAKYNPVYLDAICYLFNLRLDEDVKGIRESYLNNKSSDKEIKLLELVYSFFDTTDVEKKRNVANSMNGLGYVVISSFLTAMLLIAENKYLDSTFHLENALKNGLSGLARANALLFLSLVQKQQGTAVDEARVVREIVATAPQMEEISALIIKKYRADKLSYRIARQINVIKPKIFGHILPRIKEELPRRAFSYLSRKPAHEIPYCLN